MNMESHWLEWILCKISVFISNDDFRARFLSITVTNIHTQQFFCSPLKALCSAFTFSCSTFSASCSPLSLQSQTPSCFLHCGKSCLSDALYDVKRHLEPEWMNRWWRDPNMNDSLWCSSFHKLFILQWKISRRPVSGFVCQMSGADRGKHARKTSYQQNSLVGFLKSYLSEQTHTKYTLSISGCLEAKCRECKKLQHFNLNSYRDFPAKRASS